MVDKKILARRPRREPEVLRERRQAAHARPFDSVVERVAVVELDPSCPCHGGLSFLFDVGDFSPALRGTVPRGQNHYRKSF